MRNNNMTQFWLYSAKDQTKYLHLANNKKHEIRFRGDPQWSMVMAMAAPCMVMVVHGLVHLSSIQMTKQTK